jgi:L-2,4-diaminobutyrate decarboxylase
MTWKAGEQRSRDDCNSCLCFEFIDLQFAESRDSMWLISPGKAKDTIDCASGLLILSSPAATKSMNPDSSQSGAQARVRFAYDPQRFRAAAERWVQLLSDHLQQLQERKPPVLHWAEPEANIAAAEAWLDPIASFGTWCSAPDVATSVRECPDRGSQASVNRFTQIVREMLGRGQNLLHPRYLGHQVPAAIPLAGLFDAVGAVTNQVMAIYEMGPWATAVERALINRLGQKIGWEKGAFAGLVTHGGSLGNLTGLLTARNVRMGDVWEQGVGCDDPKPVIVVHEDAHYSVARAAGVLGLGTKQVLRATLDARRRIDPQRLDEQLKHLIAAGHQVIAVSACACATPIGAFDRLHDVSQVCRRHNVWLHVDAAHGGAALFSRRYRHLLDGLDQADSLVWDAHKMMFMPALCAFVFYRDKNHRFETFRQDAPYLFDPSAPGMAEYDGGMRTLECTKRAATFGLWGTWSLFGEQLFEDLVDVTFDLGRLFHDKLRATDDFVALHEPDCNIVAFRYLPAPLRDASPEKIGQFQREIRKRLIESGRFYIVQTNLDGFGALRVTIINPLTTADDLDELLAAIREIGGNCLADNFVASRLPNSGG